MKGSPNQRSPYNQWYDRFQQYRLFAWIRRQRLTSQQQPQGAYRNSNNIPGNSKAGFWNVKYTDVLQAVFTIVIAYLTYCALDAIKEAKTANTISEKNYALAEDALQAQIQSLKTTQQQFVVTNEPFLEISNVVAQQAGNNVPLRITFKLKNLGAYPVREYKERFAYKFAKKSEVDKVKNNPFNYIKFGEFEPHYQYFTKESGTESQFTSKEIIQPRIEEYIVSGDLTLFFAGEIQYTNYATTKKKIYKYVIKILPKEGVSDQFPSKEFTYIYNENFDIKEK